LIFSLISQSPYFDPPQLQSEACAARRFARHGFGLARDARSGQRSGAKRFSGFPGVSQVASKDEAHRIAANMAKLPELFAGA
jgi:hypothetical protein